MIKTNGVICKKKTTSQKIALLIVCLYACTLYIAYINNLFLTMQSLCLYSMVGMLPLLIIQRVDIRLNSYLIWYGVFVLLSLLSCTYAQHQSKAMSSVFSVVIVWVFAFAVTSIVDDKKQMEYIIFSIIVGSVMLTLYLISDGQFKNFDDTGARFGEELTGNANVFAAIYMIASSASVYFIFESKKKVLKFIYIAAFVLQMYTIVMSGGRKYFVFPFVLMYIIALQKKDKYHRKHAIKYTVIAVIAAMVLYSLLMNNAFLYETIGYRFEDFLKYQSGESLDVETGTIVRERMVEKGLELWRQKPIIGHGLNMFSAIGGFGVYSHNNFVEILCNHGIVGFLWYYGFYIFVTLKLLCSKNNDVFRFFLIAFILCLFVYELGAIDYNSIITHIFLLFASIYSGISKNME